MRNGRVATVLVLVALAGAFLIGCARDDARDTGASAEPSAGEQSAEAYAAQLVELTNEARTAEGLEPLTGSECARAAGMERAAALVGQDELTHAPLASVIRDCAPLTTAAENLVNSSADPADVVDAWLNSPGHYANIVDPTLTEIGIGCVPDGDNLLCSQVFLGP